MKAYQCYGCKRIYIQSEDPLACGQCWESTHRMWPEDEKKALSNAAAKRAILTKPRKPFGVTTPDRYRERSD